MAGVSFKVAFSDGRVGQALLEARARGGDLTQPHKEIGAAMVVSTQQRFETETGPDGSKWPKSIRAKVEAGKTLTETGRLRNSLSFEVSAGTVSWGTNVIYGLIHQLGGEIKQAARSQVMLFSAKGRLISERSARKRKSVFGVQAQIGARSVNMPARPYLGIDDDDGTTAINIYEHYLGAPFGVGGGA